MGVDNFYLNEMKAIMDAHLPQGGHVVCLGYPDLLVDPDCLEQLYGREILQDLPHDINESAIKAWHKFFGTVYDSIELFRRLNCKVTVLDKISHRGIETIMDLNEPIPDAVRNIADLVIDTGTLEHCFNVGTAFRNMCEITRPNGVVITAAPANKLGHGYYNFCNNLYHDGFSQNGFDVISVRLLDARYKEITPIPPKKQGPPPKSIWLAIAKKTNNKPWRWPVQGAYL